MKEEMKGSYQDRSERADFVMQIEQLTDERTGLVKKIHSVR